MAENEILNKELIDPVINCNLEIALNPENVAVYVRQGATQCFNFTALKCCCNSTINIIPINPDTGAQLPLPIGIANFGTFLTNTSGICFTPASNLGAPGNVVTSATLTFRATSTVDGCINTVDLVVNFIYAPCVFCCSCRKCK